MRVRWSEFASYHNCMLVTMRAVSLIVAELLNLAELIDGRDQDVFEDPTVII